MNGAGQTISAFANLNNFIISIEEEQLDVLDSSTKSNALDHEQHCLFKSNSISSCSMSTSSFSSVCLTADDSIPFLDNFFECIICLNKYKDFKLDLNLDDFKLQNQIYHIKSCKCKFCINCLNKYVTQCIDNCDVVPLNCPDPNCSSKGYLDQIEIKSLLMLETKENDSIKKADGSILFKRYLKLCENIEILRDKTKIYCPRPNCQNVCIVKNSTNFKINQIKCEQCNFEFCSQCHKKWMNKLNKKNNEKQDELIENDSNNNKLMLINEFCDCNLDQQIDDITIKQQPDNLDNIKRCPQCSILIERVEGCAQIMCKFCKHCFCFYCLASLDNDFLLKHYTKNGPCKGKLGHSRMSLLMHRMSVVAIFTGTIFLILILSPLILLTLPFLIFSSKCRKTCYRFSTKFS